MVADDHPAVLHGVADVLTSNSDMSVVAVCNNGEAALKAIQQFAPTVAVLDNSMPGLSVLDMLASMSGESCPTKVVILTATASNEQLRTAVVRGSRGIVFKEAALDELVQCVRAVAAGGHWFPPNLIDVALQRGARCESIAQRPEETLTCRERQIVELVAKGISNKEVARLFALSEGTVKIHLHNIYKKLGVNNRTALAAMAITHWEKLQHSTYAIDKGPPIVGSARWTLSGAAA